MKKIQIIVFSLFYLYNYSQNRELDSLQNLYNNTEIDSVKIELLNEEIGYFYERNNPDSAIYYYEKSIEMANSHLKNIDKKPSNEQLTYLKLKANALRYIGIVYYEKGTYDKAIKNVLESLGIYEGIIGNTKNKQIIIDAKNGQTYCFIPLGNIHYDQSSFDKALEYYTKALRIHDELGNVQPKSGCNVNIGNVYFEKKQLDKALEFYFKALEIAESLGDKKSMSKCYNNIANVFSLQNKFENVIEYYSKSLKIKEETSDKHGVAMVNTNLAELYVRMADSLYEKNNPAKRLEALNLAIEHGKRGLEIAKEIDALPLINPSASAIMRAYKRLGNFSEAFKYAEIYMESKDSMFQDEKIKSISDAEKRFETEKKQLMIDKLNQEKEINEYELLVQKEQADRQNLFIWFIISGLLLMVVFAVFIVNRLRITRKQKKIIGLQKKVVDEKNIRLNQHIEEISAQRDEIEAQRDLLEVQNQHIEYQKQRITDSINYAKRIQEAVLPTGEYANRILGEHFILFKPKDIVSGDFYWATRINNFLIVTVVDCTGHGVPGAFMSMLGVSFLNEIVRKKEVTKASDVLDSLRSSIIEALQQKKMLMHNSRVSLSVKDGMDLVLCVLDINTKILEFAGANNPLYIVKTNKELIELLPDKQPVAIYEKMKPYTNNTIQLEKGDAVYLCTDGFSDQFGGEKCKKFMAKNLKVLFVEIAEKSMQEQNVILNDTFNKWKGDTDQIDDVTILGLRIE